MMYKDSLDHLVEKLRTPLTGTREHETQETEEQQEAALYLQHTKKRLRQKIMKEGHRGTRKLKHADMLIISPDSNTPRPRIVPEGERDVKYVARKRPYLARFLDRQGKPKKEQRMQNLQLPALGKDADEIAEKSGRLRSESKSKTDSVKESERIGRYASSFSKLCMATMVAEAVRVEWSTSRRVVALRSLGRFKETLDRAVLKGLTRLRIRSGGEQVRRGRKTERRRGRVGILERWTGEDEVLELCDMLRAF